MNRIFKLTLMVCALLGASIVINACCEQQPGYTTAPTTVETKPVLGSPVVGDLSEVYDAYVNQVGRTVTINRGGVKYDLGLYTSKGIVVLNITKDSLEVALLKKQFERDSLQVEVFKKYLKN